MLQHYTCSFAGDGVEALEQLSSKELPHYIFLDLNMPKLNGIQCLGEIRKQPHLQQVPVAIYSTSTDESSKAQAMSLGATAFISKPARFNELVSRLNDFFREHQHTQGA